MPDASAALSEMADLIVGSTESPLRPRTGGEEGDSQAEVRRRRRRRRRPSQTLTTPRADGEDVRRQLRMAKTSGGDAASGGEHGEFRDQGDNVKNQHY
jgi:hypothetical protein